MKTSPLSDAHLQQLGLAVTRALAQWLPGPVGTPLEVVKGLERVLLFLRQNGSPSPQARQVASLAFCWGEQLVREGTFRWANVVADDEPENAVNPSIVSADGQRACLVVDCVTMLVLEPKSPALSALFRELNDGQCPSAPGIVRLAGG